MGLRDKIADRIFDKTEDEFKSYAGASFTSPETVNYHSTMLAASAKRNKRAGGYMAALLNGNYEGEPLFILTSIAESWVAALKAGLDVNGRLQYVMNELPEIPDKYIRMRIDFIEKFYNYDYNGYLTPVCLNCGAIITAWFTECPCCNIKLANGRPVYDNPYTPDEYNR